MLVLVVALLALTLTLVLLSQPKPSAAKAKIPVSAIVFFILVSPVFSYYFCLFFAANNIRGYLPRFGNV
jgi:hypothetical protein